MGNLLAAQSGGPTTAINATLRGILEEAMVCGRYDRVTEGFTESRESLRNSWWSYRMYF